jgi:ABC-2 type transport system ATP-binding protein
VDHLSLTIPSGKVFGLLGPNGSGKSTTLKIILGLLRPTSGTCQVLDRPRADAAARRSIGFLPEAPYFYRYLSGRELVRFYARVSGVSKHASAERADALLEKVGLSGAAQRRVGTYSKGMLQRVGLAQALVHDPRLVILDEPTAGVDPIGSAEIGEIILGLKAEGRTVLLCSHLLAQVEGLCDEIAILDRGRLIRAGAVDELVRTEEARQVLVRGPFSKELEEELGRVLERYGAALEAVEAPRLSLDQLFLREVGRSREPVSASSEQKKESRS